MFKKSPPLGDFLVTCFVLELESVKRLTPSSVVGLSICTAVLWETSASMLTAGLRHPWCLIKLFLLPRTSSSSMRLASSRRTARTLVGMVTPSAA